MSQLIHRVLDVPLASTTKLVLIMLAVHANKKGVCWPSIRRIVSQTGLSERAVRYQIRALEQGGFMKTVIRSHDGRQTSSRYHLNTSFIRAMGAPHAPPGATSAPPRGHHVPPMGQPLPTIELSNELSRGTEEGNIASTLAKEPTEVDVNANEKLAAALSKSTDGSKAPALDDKADRWSKHWNYLLRKHGWWDVGSSGMQYPLGGKELGFLKNVVMRARQSEHHELAAVLGTVIANWQAFAQGVKVDDGLKFVPAKPTTWFVDAHLHACFEFHADVQSVANNKKAANAQAPGSVFDF